MGKEFRDRRKPGSKTVAAFVVKTKETNKNSLLFRNLCLIEKS